MLVFLNVSMTRNPPKYIIKALASLSKHFNLKNIKIIWTLDTRRGEANVLLKYIYIGPKCWRKLPDSFLHEFAHLYNYKLYNGTRHDITYWTSLEEVVRFYYKDPTKYKWRTEYKSGIAYAKKHNLIK